MVITCAVAILDLAYRGVITLRSHYCSTTHFLHLYTLKISLKLHVCVIKILGLAMPTLHQDFSQLVFQPGAWLPSPP